MPEQLERLYIIGGQRYWEDNLKKSENCTVYHLDGNPYTQKQLETMSESWSIFYNIDGMYFRKETLGSYLSSMGPEPDSNRTIRSRVFTRQQFERALSLTETPAPATTPEADPSKLLSGTQEPDDDSRSEITQTTFSNEGIETPPANEDEEEDEEDELITKVLANLQVKTQAVKKHKKLAAEVVKLRKLLADKEAELTESEKILALEIGQVKAG